MNLELVDALAGGGGGHLEGGHLTDHLLQPRLVVHILGQGLTRNASSVKRVW
jgi:hypothetical protein